MDINHAEYEKSSWYTITNVLGWYSDNLIEISLNSLSEIELYVQCDGSGASVVLTDEVLEAIVLAYEHLKQKKQEGENK